MDNVLYYNDLYDLYGSLLTDKQKEYFEDYYFNNLSFAEIAENRKISRNAVFKQIKIVTEKLDEFESNLNLLAKKKKLLNILENVDDHDLVKAIEELL